MKDRWLVLVKMYGNSPRKLLKRIKAKTLVNKIVLPFILGLFIRILNSKCRV